NCVGSVDFLEGSRARHLNGGDDQEQYNRGDEQKQQTKPPSRVWMLVGGFIGHSLAVRPVGEHLFGVHPCAKNLEISSAAMAPSRMMRQRVASSVRSMMVEATSRGEAPPSTMMLMRPSSCSRTCSALVHSEAPLRFAEVAVIGMAAAVTTANGIFALGTRS